MKTEPNQPPKRTVRRPGRPSKEEQMLNRAGYLAAQRRRAVAGIISSCASLVKDYAYDGGDFYAQICETMRVAVDELTNIGTCDAETAAVMIKATNEGGEE